MLMNIVHAINLALRQEMERDPSVLVLGDGDALPCYNARFKFGKSILFMVIL